MEVGEAVTKVGDVTAEWLTEVFERNGFAEPIIQNLKIESSESGTSSVHKIKVIAPDANLPTNLFLKICRFETSFGNFGLSELYYYTRDYITLKNRPLPRCYDAGVSSEKGVYHILLEDLSETHSPNWEVTPTPGYGEKLATAMATLHAHWWGATRLEEYSDNILISPQLDPYMAHIRPGLEPMLQELERDDKLQMGWETTLRTVFERHPAQMLARTANSVGFTVVHGDANPGNVLSPKTGDAPLYLIDRQPFEWSLTIWLGVSDLAYAMVHWWEPEIRRKLEVPVLRRYLEILEQNGVTDYSWVQLWDDYRLCAVQSIYVATQWCANPPDIEKMKWVWLPQLQKALTAYADLDCEKLLGN
jgi:thiamine kinase-like enzyme